MDMKDSLDASEQEIVVGNSTEARVRLEKQLHADAEKKRNDAEEEALSLEERKREAKEAKMDIFFDDPELSVKIFFSAHYREKGLIWYVIYFHKLPTHHGALRFESNWF